MGSVHLIHAESEEFSSSSSPIRRPQFEYNSNVVEVRSISLSFNLHPMCLRGLKGQ